MEVLARYNAKNLRLAAGLQEPVLGNVGTNKPL